MLVARRNKYIKNIYNICSINKIQPVQLTNLNTNQFVQSRSFSTPIQKNRKYSFLNNHHMEPNTIKAIPKLKMVNSVHTFGLPIDENPENDLKQVRKFNYSKVTPTPLENVHIASLSKDCMQWIGLGEVAGDV